MDIPSNQIQRMRNRGTTSGGKSRKQEGSRVLIIICGAPYFPEPDMFVLSKNITTSFTSLFFEFLSAEQLLLAHTEAKTHFPQTCEKESFISLQS